MTPGPVRLYRFGSSEVDPSARTLTDAGKRVAIPSRVFDLLLYMVRNPGRLLTKEELLRSVWGDLAIEEGNLTQSVFLLRKALAGGSPACPVIVTIPGRGYQFAASVAEIAWNEEPPSTQPIFRDPKARSYSPGRRGLAVAAVIVAAVGLAAGWLWYTRTVPGDHHGIVLADFENATGDPEFDHALGAALNIALAIDLKQSPFLSISPGSQTAATLKLMERRPGEKMVPSLAREVCQRIDDQAVLAGTLSRFGGKYLITLTASDCVSGRELVQTKAMADDRDNIPGAVDSVASEMRKRLGEPLRSLRRFYKPLLDKQTGSLDALKAYSQAHELGAEGRFPESVPLFRRAIELDPRFAIAWGDLGVVYSNLGEPALAAAASRKAWELRDLADEPDRLFITATYNGYVTGNLHESILNYETWTETYARNATAWTNLANAQTQIGRPDLSVEPARRALMIDVRNAVAYVVLARAQLRTGRIDDALATCQQAIIQKVDGAEIHGLMTEAAFARHDQAATEEQIAWAKGTAAEANATLQQMLMGFAGGRPHAALDAFAQLADGYRRRGMQERARRIGGGVPRLEAELGMTEAARKLLAELPPIEDSTDIAVALAEVGEASRAETMLRDDLRKFPEDTLWQYVRGPQIHAAVLLSRGKPEEAVDALRRGIPYDLRSFDLPAMRGRAYLAAKQPDRAEAEFRKIVDHPGVEPLSENLPLAHLGLARALALEGNVQGSREEYGKLFTLWKDADPDVPALRAAKTEYAKLGMNLQPAR